MQFSRPGSRRYPDLPHLRSAGLEKISHKDVDYIKGPDTAVECGLMGGLRFVDPSGASRPAAMLAEVPLEWINMEGACHRVCQDVSASVRREVCKACRSVTCRYIAGKWFEWRSTGPRPLICMCPGGRFELRFNEDSAMLAEVQAIKLICTRFGASSRKRSPSGVFSPTILDFIPRFICVGK